MQLVKSTQTIDALSKFDDFFKTPNIECWEKPSGKIKLYLFSIVYETAHELLDNYKELRDHIAISFQSRSLQNSAERWNIYILYLVKQNVPEEIKQVILQDKFSSRKLVCTTGEIEINDAFINSLVDKTLIDIEIPQRQVEFDQLEELLNSNHPQIAAARNALGLMSNRDNLKTLISFLGDE